MSRRITTWRPDSCHCEIRFSDDPTDRVEPRLHQIESVDRCACAHPDLVIGQQLEGSAFHNEHIRHMRVLAEMFTRWPSLVPLVNLFQWAVDAQRHMTIHHPKLTAPQIIAIQRYADDLALALNNVEMNPTLPTMTAALAALWPRDSVAYHARLSRRAFLGGVSYLGLTVAAQRVVTVPPQINISAQPLDQLLVLV